MRRQVGFIDIFAIGIFILSLVFGSFLYGVIVGKYLVFPYDLVARIEGVVKGFWLVHFGKSDLIAMRELERGGATTIDRLHTREGFTLVVGMTEQGYQARLIDKEGSVVHRWHADPYAVFPAAPHLMWRGPASEIAWFGAHLYPDGGLLFNFHSGSFPFGGGLVRLDKNSQVLWALPRSTHHDVEVDEQGNIWVPELRYQPNPLARWPHLRPWVYEDYILKVAPDGLVLEEIRVFDAIASHPGWLSITYRQQLDVASGGDPLHLNNVEPLPAAIADRFPLFEAGDLLLSFRNINTIAVLDRKTRRFKWSMTGPFVRQHDPDFLPNGHIMLFDNLGGDPACGGSRILEIDPGSQAIVPRYDGCGSGNLYSGVRGEQQLLPNGNVLIVEANAGRLLEIAGGSTPRVVWQYNNAWGIPNQGLITAGVISDAYRFERDQLPFVEDQARQALLR